MKQNKKKAPPKPRLPRPKVPESERRRSSRLQGGTAEPERLTYDEWSDDERPRQRSRGSGGRRARKNRLVELPRSSARARRVQHGRLRGVRVGVLHETTPSTRRRDHQFMYTQVDGADGEHLISGDNRRQVIRQVTKLVSGEGVHYDSVNFGWPDDVIFRKDEPVTMQSNAVPNQIPSFTPSTRRSSHRSDIGQIIEDAREFENTHGRDHGNGWLLNHPLRKLLFYQHHLDTQARLAPPPSPSPSRAEEEARRRRRRALTPRPSRPCATRRRPWTRAR